MDGINCLNVRTNGVSRDQIMGAANIVRGAFLLAHDDHELVPMARSVGMKVIFRKSGDQGEALDRDPMQFVQERANAGADYIHLTNEVGSSPRLHEWTRKALEAATAIGVKAVAYNYGTNAPRGAYEAGRTNLEYAVKHNHAIGVHVYLDGSHDEGAWDWLDLKHQLGGLWIATEFAYIRSIFDAEKGWRGQLSETVLKIFLDTAIPKFADENVPVCHFSYDDWPSDPKKRGNGFGLWQAGNILYKFKNLNMEYQFEESKVMTSIAAVSKPVDAIAIRTGKLVPKSSFVNLRIAPNVDAPLVPLYPNGVPLNETVTLFAGGEVTMEGWMFSWVQTAKGIGGWMARVWDSWDKQIIIPVAIKLHTNLGLPFVSQNGWGEYNLCFEACICMLTQTADNPLDVAALITGRKPGKETTYDQGIDAADRLGLTLTKVPNPTIAQMIAELKAGYGFIVNVVRNKVPGWQQIYAQDPTGWHLVVVDEVTEYTNGSVVFGINDPLSFAGQSGDGLPVPAATLIAAMSGAQALFVRPKAVDPTGFTETQWAAIDARIAAKIKAIIDLENTPGK